MRIILLLCFCALWSTQALAVKKTIRLACYDLNPYVSDNRNERGYLYEIVMAAFARAHYKVDVAFYPPFRAKKIVETGERDALIPSYTSTRDAQAFLFSQPILGSQIGYFRLREKHNKAIDRLKIDEAIRDLDPLFGEEEGIIKSSSEHIIELIELLETKAIGVAIADKMQVADVLVNWRPKHIGKIEFIEPLLAVKDFHVAVSRKHPDAARILGDFDKGLAELQSSGEYEKILVRYGFQIREEGENVLNIGTVQNSDMELIKELSKTFVDEHPGTRINWYILEENLLRRSVLSSLALGDQLFDVITITNYDTAIYAENGWITPLNPPVSYDVNDLIPTIRSALSYQDKLYALPFYGESSMTYYRKDLFEANGLTMPEKPTYETIRTFAKALHQPAKGVYGICLRGKPGWGENMTLVNTMANVFGASWFDQNKRPQLNSKPWKDTLSFYLDLLQNYGPPNAHTAGYSENLQLFAAGKCAMWIDATVAASYLMNAAVSKVRNTVAFARTPVMKQEEGSHSLAAWALAVTSNSKKKDLAKDFVHWATSKKYIQLVAKEKGWLAVPPGTRRSTYQSNAYRQAAPFSGFVAEQMETAIKKGAVDEWGHPVRGPQFIGLPEYAALGTAVGINVSLSLQKKLTLERALELSQQEARQIMRE